MSFQILIDHAEEVFNVDVLEGETNFRVISIALKPTWPIVAYRLVEREISLAGNWSEIVNIVPMVVERRDVGHIHLF